MVISTILSGMSQPQYVALLCAMKHCSLPDKLPTWHDTIASFLDTALLWTPFREDA
jgi:hypothetical protein